MAARRTRGAAMALAGLFALAGCGSGDSDGAGCRGEAQGGVVIVQGENTLLTEGFTAGVGSIDVDPDSATALLVVSRGSDPAGVRTVRVAVDTTFPVAGETYTVTQVCRGSVTVATPADQAPARQAPTPS